MPRLLVRLFWITLIIGGGYYGITWSKQYYIIKMADTCTNRMWLIEEAKAKFHKDFPYRNPDSYSEILPYLPFTGFPMCPNGGEYANCLSLTQKTTCSLNGNMDYEPPTPGIDPKKNGFMDLERKRDGMTLIEFFQRKFNSEGKTKDSLQIKDEKKKKLFGTK